MLIFSIISPFILTTWVPLFWTWFRRQNLELDIFATFLDISNISKHFTFFAVTNLDGLIQPISIFLSFDNVSLCICLSKRRLHSNAQLNVKSDRSPSAWSVSSSYISWWLVQMLVFSQQLFNWSKIRGTCTHNSKQSCIQKHLMLTHTCFIIRNNSTFS